MKNDFNLETKKISFLGMKESIRDIKEMHKYFKIFLLVGAVIILFFNFFSFSVVHETHFVPAQQYWEAMENKNGLNVLGGQANDKSTSMAIAVLYSLSGIVAITGLLAVAMIVEGKTSQFFWGLINSIFTGAFALSVGYIGDFWMNIILILGAPVGWYMFYFKHKEGSEADEKQKLLTQIIFWFGIVISMVLMITLWFFLIPGAYDTMFGNVSTIQQDGKEVEVVLNGYYQNHGAAGHWLDAIVSGSNTVGYGLQLVNFTQQFYVWFFVDFCKLLKFTGIEPGTLTPTMIIQFAIWFSMDAIGIYKRVLKPMWIKTKN